MWKGPQRHKSSEKCKSKSQWNILCVEKLGLLSCVSFILTLMTLLTPAAWRSFHTAWFWYTDRAFGSVSQFWHSLPGERVGPMGEGLSPASLPALRVARGRSRATHDVCLVRQQTGICLNEDFKDESEGLGRCKNRLRHCGKPWCLWFLRVVIFFIVLRANTQKLTFIDYSFRIRTWSLNIFCKG